jgi:hypothetical protein
MFANTDLERLIICFLLIIGDALSAVAFGLMADYAANKTPTITEYIMELKNV